MGSRVNTTSFFFNYSVSADKQCGKPPVSYATKVMVVDDEAYMREAVSDILELQGFEVIVAASGQESIDLYRAQGDEINAVVLDMRMPGMDGRETYYRLKEVDPNVKVVMCSGYSETEIARQFEPGEIAEFLQKPYSITRLVAIVRSQLTG